MKKLNVIIACYLLAAFFLTPPAYAHHEKALLISSYHPGFPTFFQQIDGIKSELAPRGISLDVEFMDSKRFFSPEAIKRFHDLLKFKLKDIEPYNVIITSDDNALNFALKYRDELFPERPIVFCGVNNESLAMSQSADRGVTGVIEAVSMDATVDMIRQVVPKLGTIYAIVDSTPSGQGDLKTFHRMKTLFPEQRFEVLSLADKSWNEFLGVISRLTSQDALLLLSAYKDRDGVNKLFDKSLELIVSHTKAPIFHLWEHGLGEGVVGGKIVSHYEQGRVAGELAADIIGGKNVADIPVMGGDRANKYVVDYVKLAEFHIPEVMLPLGTEIRNKPATILDQYRSEIQAITVGVIALCVIAVILFVMVIKLRKSKTLLEESEAKHRVIFEKSPLGMILFDSKGVIVDCNDNFASLMGAPKEKLIGFKAASDSSEDMQMVLKKALGGSISAYEGEYTSVTGGKTVFLRAIFNPVKVGRGPTPVIATLEDVNDDRHGIGPKTPRQ